MPIIASCCCWRSLRKGSFISAVYTMVYFSVSIATMAHFLIEEQRYLSGVDSYPTSESFLEVETTSPTTVAFNVVLLCCSCLGVIFCFLLIVGIRKDLKCLLLPWIMIMIFDTAVEAAHTSYLFYLETFDFNPMVATLVTLDIFVAVANMYAIICVISQYQEYLAGRGTAVFDVEERLVNVQYTAHVQQNTAATYTSSAKTRTSSVSLAPSSRMMDLESSVVYPVKNSLNKPKKHVQFPTEHTIVEDSTSDGQDTVEDKKESSIASLWMEREPTTPPPER